MLARQQSPEQKRRGEHVEQLMQQRLINMYHMHATAPGGDDGSSADYDWTRVEFVASQLVHELLTSCPSPTDQMLKQLSRKLVRQFPFLPSGGRHATAVAKSGLLVSPRKHKGNSSQTGASLFPPLQAHSPRTTQKSVAHPPGNEAKPKKVKAPRPPALPKPETSTQTKTEQRPSAPVAFPIDSAASAIRPISQTARTSDSSHTWRRRFDDNTIASVASDLRSDKQAKMLLSSTTGSLMEKASRATPRATTNARTSSPPIQPVPVSPKLDMWSKLTLLDAAKYNEEQQQKRALEKERREQIREALDRQLQEKKNKRAKEEEEQQRKQKEADELRAKLDNERRLKEQLKRERDEAMKKELTEQLKLAEEERTKRQIRDHLLDEAVREELQRKAQDDALQQQRRREEAQAMHRQAQRYNASQQEARREEKRREHEEEIRHAQEAIARMDKDERIRQEQLDKIKEKQQKSANMAQSLHATQEERQQQLDEKARREREEFENRRLQIEAKNAAAKRRDNERTRAILRDQVRQHETQREKEQREAEEENKRLRVVAEEFEKEEAERREHQRLMARQHQKDLLAQALRKQEAVSQRLVTSAEERLNRRRLEQLSP